MKSSTILDFNKMNKLLFKKKFKIINLSKKPEDKLCFSQSLYLSNFLYKTKIKKTPDTSKYSNHNSLIISKKNNLLDDKIKTIKNKSKLRKLDTNKFTINNSFNSFQALKHSFSSINSNSFRIKENKDENLDNFLLYEENLKLKEKINKLRFELFLNKRLNEKKEEEIKEMNKNLDEAKILFGKKSKKFYYINKIEYENSIINLKNYYENLKLQIREQKEKNNILINKIKEINNEELAHKNGEDMQKLKRKKEELNFKDQNNQKASKKLKNIISKKQKYILNYNFLNNLKEKITQQSLKLGKLNQKAFSLKDKYYDMKSQKGKILRYNKNIKIKNKELVVDMKNKEVMVIKSKEIKQKINSFSNKTKDLKNLIGQNESSIKSYMDEQLNLIESKSKLVHNIYKSKLNVKLEDKKIKQIILYDSLINESKERQKNFVKLLIDLLENISNPNIEKEKDKSIVSEDKMYIMDNGNVNYKNNDSNFVINNDKDNNINNNENKINNTNNNDNKNNNSKKIKNNIKKEKIQYELLKYGDIGDFQFLLNVIFYIKNIQKERIQNILLCYKTENYYLGNENDDFISELTTDILVAINNKKEVNKLKEILVNLFENKYKKNKIEFLNRVIDDIYILDNEIKILFNKEDENILFHKLLYKIKNKINYMIKKINDFQGNQILFEDLKSFFTKEYLYDKESKEKVQIFQYFIYILKKRENPMNNKPLNEFNTKDTFDFLSNLEIESIIIENFIKALKNILEEKKIDLDSLIGFKKNIDIEEFTNILNENKLDFNGQNIDLNDVLKNYKKDENNEIIDIDLIKMDLKNFSDFGD